jgi:hypothetical protein
MKRYFLIPMLFLATAAFAVAQPGGPTTDVLGAHLNYGRGCAGCHAPHNGAYGNGAAGKADTLSGENALWGQDVASLYGLTIQTGGTYRGGKVSSYAETLPSTMLSSSPDVLDLLTCLSCHDGNYAKGAMMQNAVYESLPSTYGRHNTIPTLLDNASGASSTNYLANHPVGLNAAFSCNSTAAGVFTETGYNWDCTLTPSGTTSFIINPGPNMSNFIQNYGFFVSLVANGTTPVVMCTTCHNQHLMNVVQVTNDGGALAATASVTSGKSGLAAGPYQTMFFIRAPYNPANNVGGLSNQTAQFCRQCHGGESNEMNGGSAVTTW